MDLERMLADPELRDRLQDACVEALHAEVASKKGMTGMAIRSAFSAFQTVQPGMARHMFGKLLPAFVPAIEPHWAAARQGDPRAYFQEHKQEVATALLSVTDARAERAKNKMLAGLYRRLRSRADAPVADAVPRIADILTSVLPNDALV